MRRSQRVGTKYEPALDSALDKNQDSLVDELITPHSTRLNEMLGAQHKITASYPAHQVDAQPTQARGRVVWNEAYAFQPKGPSYLDGAPDPGKGGGY